MDFNTVMQGALGLGMAALLWFIKRAVSTWDTSIAKLDEKMTAAIDKQDKRMSAVEQKSDERVEKLQEQLHNLQKDMPLVYTTREDFILTMNRVEDKLNRILYRNGGNGNE